MDLAPAGDVIAVCAIGVSVQAAFLGILLPLFYSTVGQFIERLHGADPTSDWAGGVTRYFFACDTLLNLAAGYWSANIVVGASLLAAYMLTGNTSPWVARLFECGAVGCGLALYLFSAFVVIQSYEPARRELNVFCVPEGKLRSLRGLRGLLLTSASLLVPLGFAGTILYSWVSQPGTDWRPSSIVFVVLAGTALAILPVVGWILLGWHYKPFSLLGGFSPQGHAAAPRSVVDPRTPPMSASVP